MAMTRTRAFDLIASRVAVELIIASESFRDKAYPDSGGVWTIGFGRTGGVKEGDRTTLDREIPLLFDEIEVAEEGLHRSIDTELTQFEFDALVCFVYNIGAGAFAQSTMLKRINERNYGEAAKEFDRWVFAKGKKLAGLIKRRDKEEALFRGEEA
jgi:lysozyme